MPATLTEQEFSRHINTIFNLKPDGAEQDVQLELISVKGYGRVETERPMERFSILFSGPEGPMLEQQTYHFRHDSMGEFDIFLVPIKKVQDKIHYEAVFNYFTDEQ